MIFHRGYRIVFFSFFSFGSVILFQAENQYKIQQGHTLPQRTIALFVFEQISKWSLHIVFRNDIKLSRLLIDQYDHFAVERFLVGIC